jgi:hypothetical protein
MDLRQNEVAADLSGRPARTAIRRPAVAARRRELGTRRPHLSSSGRTLGRHAINLPHVVVADGSCVAVVPIYRDSAPRRPPDCTLVCRVALPTDAISDLELSRFIASHVVAVARASQAKRPQG